MRRPVLVRKTDPVEKQEKKRKKNHVKTVRNLDLSRDGNETFFFFSCIFALPSAYACQ